MRGHSWGGGEKSPPFYFYYGVFMDLYIYADESGVFSKDNDFFIISMIIFKSLSKRDIASSLFKQYEQKNINNSNNNDASIELKGSNISNKRKKKILNRFSAFSNLIVVKIKNCKIHEKIWVSPRSRQRYLDYVFKMVLKEYIISESKIGNIKLTDIKNIFIFQDEHTTATDGIYELKESIYTEFKEGMFVANFTHFVEPIMSNLNNVNVKYCDSKSVPLIRLADYLANYYFRYIKHNLDSSNSIKGIIIKEFPK